MLTFVKMMINKESRKTVLSATKTKAQDKLVEFLVDNCHDVDSLTWYYHDDSVAIAEEKTGYKRDFVNKILRQLVSLGIVHRRSRGVYVLSKEYFQVKEEKDAK